VTSRNTSTLPSGDFGGLVGRRNERQAGGAPNTVADMSTSAPSKADDANKKTGNIAVNESKRQRAQQEAVVTSNEASINYSRNVRSRNFYSINNVWTDSEFRSEAKLPETTVEFGSDAYFELIKKEPELAEYFALGEEVVVVHKGRVYRVVAAKKQ
jgi:hypothetical protein